MIRLNPTRDPDWTNASVTDPDWAMPATPPRGRYGETSPIYVEELAVRSITPMQFGPTSASRAPRDGRDLELHRCRGLPALHDAAAWDDHGRDTGGGRVARHHPGAERIERDDGDIGALRQGVEVG